MMPVKERKFSEAVEALRKDRDYTLRTDKPKRKTDWLGLVLLAGFLTAIAYLGAKGELDDRVSQRGAVMGMEGKR